MLDAGAAVTDAEAGYQLLSLKFVLPNPASPTRWADIRIHAVKMECPSTGAVYLNAVPPHIHTVHEGLDWIFDTEDYLGHIGAQA
jgi:hypothetical protein